MSILIIDPNRPGSEKNRPEPEPKIFKYLLGLNIQDPKDPYPKGIDPKTERQGRKKKKYQSRTHKLRKILFLSRAHDNKK